jgi:hypothetical protein
VEKAWNRGIVGGVLICVGTLLALTASEAAAGFAAWFLLLALTASDTAAGFAAWFSLPSTSAPGRSSVPTKLLLLARGAVGFELLLLACGAAAPGRSPAVAEPVSAS